MSRYSPHFWRVTDWSGGECAARAASWLMTRCHPLSCDNLSLGGPTLTAFAFLTPGSPGSGQKKAGWRLGSSSSSACWRAAAPWLWLSMAVSSSIGAPSRLSRCLPPAPTLCRWCPEGTAAGTPWRRPTHLNYQRHVQRHACRHDAALRHAQTLDCLDCLAHWVLRPCHACGGRRRGSMHMALLLTPRAAQGLPSQLACPASPSAAT